ncbi:MAG: hypothetical protein V1774_09800 [Candidatus Eisenbacteria bacterium]
MMRPSSQRPSGLRFLENLAYLVPGYQGYRHHELRRQEDSRMRARVCRNIDQLLREIDALSAHWNGQAAANIATGLVSVRQRLAGHAEAVRFSPGDLWRFFEAEQVSEVTLERVLEADLLIFQDLEEVQGQLDQGRQLSSAPRTVRRFLGDLDQLLHRLEEHLILRERVLAGG